MLDIHHLSIHLQDLGYRIERKTNDEICFGNGMIDFTLINDRRDGLEIWLEKQGYDRVRIDYILEYYLTGKVDLVNAYLRSDSRNEREFYTRFLEGFKSDLSSNDFFPKYHLWYKDVDSMIDEIHKLLKLPI